MTFVDLSRRGDADHGIRMFVRTNEGVGREILLFYSGRRTKVQMSRLGAQGGRVRCAIHRTVDYRHDVVVVGFPRRCVSRPSWVRIGVFAVAWLHDANDSFLIDDAQVDGAQDPTRLDVEFSPRIRRG